MRKGGVTLDLTDCASDYGRRTRSIGLERRSVHDLQHAMNNRRFKAAHHELLDELAAEYRQTLPLIERPPFMTIEIGTFKAVEDLHKALIDSKYRISSPANGLLGRITLSPKPATLDLYTATVAELGFPDGATQAQIYEAGLILGWELCPAEAGPQFRLQYPDQPDGEWDLIAMEPISDFVGNSEVFRVGRDAYGQWLYGYRGFSGSFWFGYSRWMFCRK